MDGTKKQSITDIWVVILNWNQPELTIHCANSIKENSDSEFNLLIVDNGSSDNSVKILKSNFPKAKFLVLKNNFGFAKGFNHGIQYALEHGAEYVFMVNNDTIVYPEMLDILLSYSKKLKGDILAPAIYFAENPNKIWSTGGNFNNLFSAPINSHNRGKRIPLKPTKREFLTGCALLIHKNVFREIGFFDEDFFLYYEDLDFFYRAKQSGINAWLIPKAKLLHYVSASNESENSEKVYYWMSRSSWIYFKKHAKLWQWIFILPWRLTHAAKTLINLLIQRRFSSAKSYLLGFLKPGKIL